MRLWFVLALLAGLIGMTTAYSILYINTPGLHTLSADNGPIVVNISGVTLNCAGYTIQPIGGAGTAGYITSAFGNTVVENCNVNGPNPLGSPAISLSGDNNQVLDSNISDGTIADSNYGVLSLANGINIVVRNMKTPHIVDFTNIDGCYVAGLMTDASTFNNNVYAHVAFTNVTDCDITNVYSAQHTRVIGSSRIVMTNVTPYYSPLVINTSSQITLQSIGTFNITTTNGLSLSTAGYVDGYVYNSTNLQTANYTGALSLFGVDGYVIGSGVPWSLAMTDVTNVNSIPGVQTNFTSLTLIRDSGMNIAGYIGALNVVNSSAIQTFGPVNAITLSGAIQCNFYGESTNNTTLMLNSFQAANSMDILMNGFTANAYGQISAVGCLFNPPHNAWTRPFNMWVTGSSSGITFDNMTFAGNWDAGDPPPGANTWLYWLLYVDTGASDITLKNSLLETTIDLVYDANSPSVTTLDNNGYALTMSGYKNITGVLVGRTSPLLYSGVIGRDYPYGQNTSNHTAVGATQDPCSPTSVPAYELYNVVDRSPLTSRNISNGTLNVTILYPANNQYLGQTYTFPVTYSITSGAGLTNCQVAMQQDGNMGYQVAQMIPCGSGFGESQTVQITAPVWTGYTLYVSAVDNSGSKVASVHITFYSPNNNTNGSGGGPGFCTGPQCWYCSPEHPELCWMINTGNNSSYTYYDACVAGTSQYGVGNRSYIERYITCNFGRLVGNAEMGPIVLAIMVLTFFTVFVMMQNTRLDGKLAVLIPVVILVAVWMGWIMWIVLFIVGGILFLGLIRFITK